MDRALIRSAATGSYTDIVLRFQEDAMQAEEEDDYHGALIICVDALKQLRAVDTTHMPPIRRLELQYNYDMAMARTRFLSNVISLQPPIFEATVYNNIPSADRATPSITRASSVAHLPAIQDATPRKRDGTPKSNIYENVIVGQRLDVDNTMDQHQQPVSKPISDEDDEMSKIKDRITNCVIIENPKITFDDVIGLDKAKLAMKEAIDLPNQFPGSGQAKNAWNGILLFGPSGTGKTRLLQAVAAEARMTFINVKIDTIMSKWQGESEKCIQALFEIAKERSPSIIFFDECDSLCRARSADDSESSGRIKTTLLNLMDGFSTNPESGRIIVIGNTNLPGSLDEAFRRRFPKRVHVDLPDQKDRQEMLRYFLLDYDYLISKKDFKEIAENTKKYSGADLKTLVTEAGVITCRQEMAATGGLQRGNISEQVKPRPITKVDFLAALRTVKPTNDEKLLSALKQFNDKFGGVPTVYEPESTHKREPLLRKIVYNFLHFFSGN